MNKLFVWGVSFWEKWALVQEVKIGTIHSFVISLGIGAFFKLQDSSLKEAWVIRNDDKDNKKC